MSTTYKMLRVQRNEFDAFAERVLGKEDLERDDLSYLDRAKLIDDPEERRRFCKLAISMLDADIFYYKPEATPRPLEEPSRPGVAASTLIMSGVAYYLAGPAVTLIVAGLWYWGAADVALRLAAARREEVRIHNEQVAGWADTIEAWERERDALRDYVSGHS